MISQNRGGLPIFLADLGVAVADGIARYGLDGFAPGDVIDHEPGRGLRPAPQQRGDLLAVLPRRRAGGVRRQPRPLGRYRRHAAGLRLLRTRPTSTPRACSCARSRSTRPASATRRCGRSSATTCAIPEAALGDLRAQIACCQLGVAALRRTARALRPRHGRGLHRTRSGTQAEREARAVVAKIPDGDLRGRELPRQRRPHARQAAAHQGQGA